MNNCTKNTNIEQDNERRIHWIDIVMNLYANTEEAEEGLFYKNDFKAFVDLLVSIVDNENERTNSTNLDDIIESCLACYMVLSCSTLIMEGGKYYRLEHLQEKVKSWDLEALKIVEVAK